MKILGLVIMGLVLCGCQAATGVSELKDESDKINYSIGYQIGGDFKRQDIEMRSAVVLQGIEDARQGRKPLIEETMMQKTLIDLKKRIVAADQKALLAKARPSYKGEGRAYLEQNAKREGVIALSEGVQYEVLATGTGPRPTEMDQVEIHLVSSLPDGREMTNTRKGEQPAVYLVSKLVPGVRHALMKMRQGDRWKLYVSADLAYGDRSPLDERVLIMDVELLKVMPLATQ